VTAQPASAAIVPYRSKTPTIVQFAADGVAADMRVEPLDRQRRTSLYTIRLASSDESVSGRLIGVNPSGDAVELGDLSVAPGSIGGARLTVAAPRGGYRAVYLEIRSERLLLQVEAPKPPSQHRVRPVALATVFLALGAVSLGAAAVALALPQPPVLRGPDHATAGDPVRVQYATHGYGNERYTARYDDGVVFASGALDAQNGELTLALPNDAVNRRVWIAVTTEGLLGAAASVTSFAVVAQPSHKAIAAAPLAHRPPAPHVAMPAPPIAVPPPAPKTMPAPVTVVRQAPSETAGMLSFDASAAAGSSLAVRVMPHRTGMTVAMQDASGETLAEREIAPGTTRVTLPMPDQPAQYFLVLHYDAEDGAQTVVRPVRAVAPRAGQAISR